MSVANLFILTPNWKQPNMSLICGEWIVSLSTYTTGNYSVLKRNSLLIYATIWWISKSFWVIEATQERQYTVWFNLRHSKKMQTNLCDRKQSSGSLGKAGSLVRRDWTEVLKVHKEKWVTYISNFNLEN